MQSYCSDFRQQPTNWNLAHPAINIYTAWRKGLRQTNMRISLSYSLQAFGTICSFLLSQYHLYCQVSFQYFSNNRIIELVTRNGTLFSKMLSAIGRNAQFDVSLCDIVDIDQRIAWSVFDRHCLIGVKKLNVIKELTCVKYTV